MHILFYCVYQLVSNNHWISVTIIYIIVVDFLESGRRQWSGFC